MKMFLDDIREPQNDYDVIVRNFEEAVEFVQKYGIPTFISFESASRIYVSNEESSVIVPPEYPR